MNSTSVNILLRNNDRIECFSSVNAGRSDLVYQNSPEMQSWQDAPFSAFTDPKRSAWQPTNSDKKNAGAQSKEDEELIATILSNEKLSTESNNRLNQGMAKTNKQPVVTETADDNVTRCCLLVMLSKISNLGKALT